MEEYYYRGQLLSTDALYRLEGQLAFRDGFAGGDPPVDDPDFIEQSNDPLYWSQTFEFRVVAMEWIADKPALIKKVFWSQIKKLGPE